MGMCAVCGSNRSRVLCAATATPAHTTSSAYYVPTYSHARLHGEISRCAACGFVFVSDSLPAGDLERAYAEMADPGYLREAGVYHRAADWVLARLEPWRGAGARLLDIGCGTGFLLEQARKAGWDVRGIELSRWMVEQARQRLPGDVVRQGGYDSGHFREIAFDVVVAVDVIEHVPDPEGFVREIANRLRPGGIACLVTPDIGSLVARALGEGWWYIQVPHLNYFDRSTLARLAGRLGLRVVRQASYPRFVTSEIVRNRLSYLPAPLRAPAGFLLALLLGAGRTARVDLGDQLMMLVGKP